MAQREKTAFMCTDKWGRHYVLICIPSTNSGGEVIGTAGRAVSIASLSEAVAVARSQGATLVPMTH